MEWIKKYMTVKQYVFTSLNQHGSRYKQDGFKRISVAHISCKPTDAGGMKKLILLSHTLDVPVRYDFEGDQEAYIEVISGETLKESICHN